MAAIESITLEVPDPAAANAFYAAAFGLGTVVGGRVGPSRLI
jgi:catechol 2,3-dioxygenase-like lactoylglutathione lyase family enzyme